MAMEEVGVMTSSSPKPPEEMELWRIDGITDLRPFNWDTGKRDPIPEHEMADCDRCGRKHAVIFHMVSNRGRAVDVGSGCGTAMAGGAEYIDQDSLKEAKKAQKEGLRSQLTEKVDRWIDELKKRAQETTLPKFDIERREPAEVEEESRLFFSRENIDPTLYVRIVDGDGRVWGYEEVRPTRERPHHGPKDWEEALGRSFSNWVDHQVEALVRAIPEIPAARKESPIRLGDKYRGSWCPGDVVRRAVREEVWDHHERDVGNQKRWAIERFVKKQNLDPIFPRLEKQSEGGDQGPKGVRR
jgi:hypothetical protein